MRGRRPLLRRMIGLFLATGVLWIAGCQKAPKNPLTELSRLYDRYPECSIILSDMDVSGNFFKSYHHRYRILHGEQTADASVAPPASNGTETEGGETPDSGAPGDASPEAPAGPSFNITETGWMEVDRDFYQRHEPHLGMVLLSKGEGANAETAAYPPGYQYVGNSRYGRWRTDRNGTSFWEFYGSYVIFSHLLGNNRPIYRSDYDSYRDFRRQNRPYYGADNAYGTRGTFTRASNPTFYERQQVRQRTQNERFAKKARSRTSSSRSRSRSRGK